MDDPQRKPKLCNLGVWPLTWAIVLLSILVSFHAAEAVHGERAGEGLQIHKKGDRAGDIHAEFQRQNSTNEAAGQGTPISIELPKLPLVVNSSDGLPSRDQMQASLACEVDLGGKGSLDATCELKDSVTLSSASSIQGAGNLTLLQGVTINCSLPDCLIKITLGGDLKLLKDARIEGGQLHIEAENVVIKKGGAISAQALGGKPPPQTSGSPTTSDGSGGGHGGRGASCSKRGASHSTDTWGGDVYAWSTLDAPWMVGSKGGPNKGNGTGGGGGGRIHVVARELLYVEGEISAEGGDGEDNGGGGSGGSVIAKARTLDGLASGRISAAGGNGHAGGGGGRVAFDFESRSNVDIVANGGQSLGCPENSGAAGTLFDVSLQTLTISNEGRHTRTRTPLFDFPNHPLWTNFVMDDQAKVVVLSLWSRVQVQGKIVLTGFSVLNFGLAGTAWAELELFGDEIVMRNSSMYVYGAMKLAANQLLLDNATVQIIGGSSVLTRTTVVEVNHLELKTLSSIESNANLGIQGQGLMAVYDSCRITARKLFVSLFFLLKVAAGATLQAPTSFSDSEGAPVALYCDQPTCPPRVIQTSQDCSIDPESPFTLQLCRIEELLIEGVVKGAVVHIQRTKLVTVGKGGQLTAAGQGCGGGQGVGAGQAGAEGVGGGGGHGGRGGNGSFNNSTALGGGAYGAAALPCALGSGGGVSRTGEDGAGGGVIVLGGKAHPLQTLELRGWIVADGQTSANSPQAISAGGGGGSGGTILMFLNSFQGEPGSIISSSGGSGGAIGGGGGAGGRVHFEWANIKEGDAYVRKANSTGVLRSIGGRGSHDGGDGEPGSLTALDCPPGLYGLFCDECPLGTYKVDVGYNESLCKPCPPEDLPHHSRHIPKKGGVTSRPCPYECVASKYSLPHCNTPIEDLISSFGGPLTFSLLNAAVLVLMAVTLSVARVRIAGTWEADDPPSPKTPDAMHINQSHPFLESLNEVMESNRAEESAGHLHRLYFTGSNSFGEPWRLPHPPPEQILDLVYEDAYNRFVEAVNERAGYQWYEGMVYSALLAVCCPLAWSWLQWRRQVRAQALHQYVSKEYDHACLRSCRARALYEGLKVHWTPDLLLGYIDFFLGGDEKRSDLPPRLPDRLPLALIFGGDGGYMTPYHLHSDDLLTSLLGQMLPASIWYRMVAGLNAQLRTVRQGCLRRGLAPLLAWIGTHANPWLRMHGLRIDLAWFQATSSGYYQLGVILSSSAEPPSPVLGSSSIASPPLPSSPVLSPRQAPPAAPPHLGGGMYHYSYSLARRRIGGGIVDGVTLRSLQDRKTLLYPTQFVMTNLKPMGHHAAVGLLMSSLLLSDLCLSLLLLLQFYSISLTAFLLVLLLPPFIAFFAAAAGLNALFTHVPRRAASLARYYNLWNGTSMWNVVVAVICGAIAHSHQGWPAVTSGTSDSEYGWWLFPLLLFLVKILQARTVDYHVGNLEIADRTLYSEDPTNFWEGP